MMLGVYLGQYCINALTYFFLTWFPVYLVKERGLSILQAGFVATLPALCGFFGGVLGGVISDYILRKTGSLTLARKIPIVGGMLLSMAIIACNYVDGQALVVGFMALAFFGKGIGALGWAVVSDTSPKQIGGVSRRPVQHVRQSVLDHDARSSSATSWPRPARSTARWCSSAPMRSWPRSPISWSSARSSGWCSNVPPEGSRGSLTRQLNGGSIGRRLCFGDDRC